MSDFASNVPNLSPRQQARLLQRLRSKSGDSPVEPIQRQSRDQPDFPLSFAQQRLWFLEQWQPGSPLYHIPLAVKLQGSLHVEALRRSLQTLIARHEVLRTVFAIRDGQPVQRILPALALPFSVTDLTNLPEQQREAAALDLAVAASRQPFDLARGPLLRVALLRLHVREHLLVLTLHHIVADGWSMGILLNELSTCYRAALTGQPVTLPALHIQYVDFALWQRRRLAGAVLQQHLSYWEKQLADIPPAIELPGDRPRPAIQTFRGARFQFLLPTRLLDALQALSQREGATLFMTLLAAFQTLLWRYTNQDDIVVGTPIASRTSTVLERLIGFFVNTLVLRTRFSSNATFRELLGQVREVTLQAYMHQDLPFERLVEHLQPERALSHTPLFQVLFALQNTPEHVWDLAGVQSREVVLDTGTTKFELVLLLEKTVNGLAGHLTYSTDLFEEESIARLAGHYRTLLEGIVSDPEQRIWQLPLLTEGERRQMLVAWNATTTSFPEQACLHQLFEAQAERAPEAIAVVCEDQAVSYGTLNRRANRLAQRLRQEGVGPDVVVGICLERGMDLVVALLAILKAGGAYLPLDPDYPHKRLDFMLRDAQVPLLITRRSLQERLPAHRARVIDLDDSERPETELATREENLGCGVNPEHLAYVIYTSGSTGEPKGIALRHRGVVNNICDLNTRFSVGRDDSVLALSSVSFDMCVYETLGMLATGAKTIIPAPERAQDPACWASLLARHQVTLWNSAPSLLAMLIEYVEGHPRLRPRSLRLALLGGDWSPVTLPDRFRAIAEHALFVNLGGATELSIHSTIAPIEHRNPAWQSLPYGKPMANQQAWILDDRLQPVPPGVPGELYLGGIGLARGYLHRPALTAERFLPHPWSHVPGARLYQTGDLARFRSDGMIELLGRRDFQVKIRGLRIELGEIAAVLRQHASIRDALVHVNDAETSEKQLVAFILPEAGTKPLATELWAFLQQRLPAYMLPAAFIALEAFPLSPNGKVDRRALSALAATDRLESAEPFVPARTPLEEVLCGIWADVLGREQVGVHENFFHLGGHSLLAMRIITQISELVLMDVPLRTFFAAPTIAALADYLETTAQQEQRDVQKIAQVVLRMNQLSDEQVQAMLKQYEPKEEQT